MATVACDIGDLVELSVAFTKPDVNGVQQPTDPTTVTLQVKDPAGTVTTPALVHDGPGAYHYNWLVTLAGVLVYRFAGTGAVVAAEEAKVFARDSAFS